MHHSRALEHIKNKYARARDWFRSGSCLACEKAHEELQLKRVISAIIADRGGKLRRENSHEQDRRHSFGRGVERAALERVRLRSAIWLSRRRGNCAWRRWGRRWCPWRWRRIF